MYDTNLLKFVKILGVNPLVLTNRSSKLTHSTNSVESRCVYTRNTPVLHTLYFVGSFSYSEYFAISVYSFRFSTAEGDLAQCTQTCSEFVALVRVG